MFAFQYICILIYLGISYVLTGQPLEVDRINYLFLIAIMMMLCSQSWGYFLGSLVPIKVTIRDGCEQILKIFKFQIAVFLGPVLVCALSAFGFCMSYEQTPDVIKWVYSVSYFRAGFHLIAETVLGLGRKKLHCPMDAVYCHYVDPNEFLQEMGIVNISFFNNLSLISVMAGTLFLVTYGALWFKLHKR